MMKRLILLTLALLILALPALAEPFPLLEDWSDTITVPYDEADPDAGQYTYTYHYPHVDESDPDAYLVNSFYEYAISDAEAFGVPILADYYVASGESVTTDISYTLTCNNDDYLSLLLCTTDQLSDMTIHTYAGHSFSRSKGTPGSVLTLPQLLGILATDENDTWLQERQTEKANVLVRSLIREQMEENPNGTAFYEGFSAEELETGFYPEEDFYLDENGDPVFFLQPGLAAPEEEGLLTFPIPLDDILDEL